MAPRSWQPPLPSTARRRRPIRPWRTQPRRSRPPGSPRLASRRPASPPPQSPPPRSRPPIEAGRRVPGGAAEAGRAARFQGAGAEAIHPRQRPPGRPRAVGNDAEGAGHAEHADRQRVRTGERGLARRPDRRSDARRHHDPHRCTDFGAGGTHGRVADGCRGWRQHHDRRGRAQRVRPADGRARRRRRPESEVSGVGAGAAEGQPAPQPRRLVEPAAADRPAEIPGGDVRRPRLRPGVSDRGHDQGLHARSDPPLLSADVWRRPIPALRRRPVRRARCRSGDPEGLRRVGQGCRTGPASGQADARPEPSTSWIAPAPRSRR